MPGQIVPWEKGRKLTPESIEAAIRARYWMLISDSRPVIREDTHYDDGGGFSKDEGQRGPERADWSRDFVIAVLQYAETNKCSRNAAVEAIHEDYCRQGHYIELASRKRIFNRFHSEMRLHNFALAILNNDLQRAIDEALVSQPVRNRLFS